MTRDEAEWAWSHWAGTLDQVVRATHLAAQRLEEAVPFPDDYDPESDEAYDSPEKRAAYEEARSARKLSITLAEADGFTSHPDEISALESLTERETGRIERIDIEIGSWSHPMVRLQLGGHQGFSAKVVGLDRAWTAGVRHELEEILEPDRQLHAPLLGQGAGQTALLAVTPALLIFSVVTNVLVHVADWEQEPSLAVGVGCGLVVLGALVAAAWASARFELLQPGELPRFQRSRRFVAAALWAAFSALVVPIVIALIVAP